MSNEKAGSHNYPNHFNKISFFFYFSFFSAKVQGREQYDFILLRFSTPAFPAGFSLFQ